MQHVDHSPKAYVYLGQTEAIIRQREKSPTDHTDGLSTRSHAPSPSGRSIGGSSLRVRLPILPSRAPKALRLSQGSRSADMAVALYSDEYLCAQSSKQNQRQHRMPDLPQPGRPSGIAVFDAAPSSMHSWQSLRCVVLSRDSSKSGRRSTTMLSCLSSSSGSSSFERHSWKNDGEAGLLPCSPSKQCTSSVHVTSHHA